MADSLPGSTPDARADAVDDPRPVSTVTLLTQVDCGLCDHAKQVLQRIRQDPSVPIRLAIVEVQLGSAQGRQLAADAGVLFAPGVLLDGQPFAHGRLSERKLRRALSRAPNSTSYDRQ